MKDLIDRRAKRDRELFYVEVHTEQHGPYTICRRKKLYGVYAGGTEVFPIVFDQIRIVDTSLFGMRIGEKWALADTAKRLTPFEYSDFKLLPGGFVEIESVSTGKKGIFSVGKWKEVVVPVYDEIGHVTAAPLVWAREGRTYDYVSLSDGHTINFAPLRLAYDTAGVMAGLSESGPVVVLDSEGRASDEERRRAVIEAGGHLLLQNFSKRLEHIIDVYGNILNL